MSYVFRRVALMTKTNCQHSEALPSGDKISEPKYLVLILLILSIVSMLPGAETICTDWALTLQHC